MSAPNHINGIVAFLRADAAVAARVGTRVYGPDGVPKSQNASMPRQAIVVSPVVDLGVAGDLVGGQLDWGRAKRRDDPPLGIGARAV